MSDDEGFRSGRLGAHDNAPCVVLDPCINVLDGHVRCPCAVTERRELRLNQMPAPAIVATAMYQNKISHPNLHFESLVAYNRGASSYVRCGKGPRRGGFLYHQPSTVLALHPSGSQRLGLMLFSPDPRYSSGVGSGHP